MESSDESKNNERQERISRNLKTFLSLQKQNQRHLEAVSKRPIVVHHRGVVTNDVIDASGAGDVIAAAASNGRKVKLGQIRGQAVMFSYDPGNLLDRDMNLISPELRPIPPQPNCPQSMQIYQDSRMMASALLKVRMETNQLQMQKADLESKLNQTDADFALSMAQANDGSFPFDKQQVAKYYDLKAKQAALVQYHEQLSEQYEQQKRQLEAEGKTAVASSSNPEETITPSSATSSKHHKSRNPFKRLLKHHHSKTGVPVPDPVDVKSKSVEDWEWVDKSNGSEDDDDDENDETGQEAVLDDTSADKQHHHSTQGNND